MSLVLSVFSPTNNTISFAVRKDSENTKKLFCNWYGRIEMDCRLSWIVSESVSEGGVGEGAFNDPGSPVVSILNMFFSYFCKFCKHLFLFPLKSGTNFEFHASQK